MMHDVEIRHAHFFCGLGGGAKGFNRGEARAGNLRAKFVCLGGIDNDAGALRDFENAAGVPGTLLDLFSLEQYVAFHGKQPPPGWQEATTADIARAFGYKRPHIVFLSAPCKGFSGLLSEKASSTARYQALNQLTLRGVWLMLETWKDDPPELIVFENVPRIMARGRHLLDQICALLRAYGYATAETTHDCGEIGGLGQSRKRFLLVARHIEKVPPFLYEPVKRPLRGVGEILETLPVPLCGLGGPMHRMPALQWKTWLRLAFVEAGSDWRSLNKLRVDNGVLTDFGIEPCAEWHNGAYGVKEWREPAGTVTSNGRPASGAFAVADPRFVGRENQQYGVRRWGDTSGAITSQRSPGQGTFAVADPRPTYGPNTHHHAFKIVPWGKHGGTITASGSPSSGALCVADPRSETAYNGKGKYRVTRFNEPAGTVISASTTGNGAFAVADPRPAFLRQARQKYQTAGQYGVVPWDMPSGAIAAQGQHDNGRNSVADPRLSTGIEENYSENYSLPASNEQLVCVIRALDGTWHRPFTTLELAALQGLVDPGEQIELDGLSDSAWRERIGNAVPPPAAAAIAGVMGRTLLAAWSGQTFLLSNEAIWVRQVPAALMAAQP